MRSADRPDGVDGQHHRQSPHDRHLPQPDLAPINTAVCTAPQPKNTRMPVPTNSATHFFSTGSGAGRDAGLGAADQMLGRREICLLTVSLCSCFNVPRVIFSPTIAFAAGTFVRSGGRPRGTQ